MYTINSVHAKLRITITVLPQKHVKSQRGVYTWYLMGLNNKILIPF